jgi:predicted RNase H-like HicB family nuclease
MLRIEIEREEDGRWIGEVPDFPGVLAYGATEAEARIKTTALALHVIADRIEHGEPVPFEPSDLFFAAGRPQRQAEYCGR